MVPDPDIKTTIKDRRMRRLCDICGVKTDYYIIALGVIIFYASALPPNQPKAKYRVSSQNTFQ
jgi:ssDNA-binding Zn-finger/Zn-ribbon topoisomerase 1